MKRNKILLISFIVLITLSFIFYAGQFLYHKKPAQNENTATNTAKSSSTGCSQPEVQDSLPLTYSHISDKINSYKQEIFTLEFDPKDPRIDFFPALSYDNFFGYEKLSEMSARNGAYASINGGFFYEYGDPVGMVAFNGKLWSNSTGRYPILVLDGNGAHFEQFYSSASFSISGTKKRITNINRTGKKGDIILYTPEYGSSTRSKTASTSLRIENDTVTEVSHNSGAVDLTKNTTVLSFFGDKAKLVDQLKIKEGQKISIETFPTMNLGYSAYECGCWLVKDGKVIVPEYDSWIGVLTNHDPRTAIGVKADGRVILMVVDGRQPGYSTGFTGQELAQYLVQKGVKDAAMLDGGASSQLFVDGTLKNKPSYMGIERPLGGGLFIKIKNK